jgi:hypothetical protein
MTGLASFLLCAPQNDLPPAYVLVTDGNQRCAESISDLL